MSGVNGKATIPSGAGASLSEQPISTYVQKAGAAGTLVGLSWDDLRIVKAIGDRQTVAAGAATLGINSSTVFRRLSQIEKTLGTALFDRRRAGYVPTAAGMEVIALAQRVEVDIFCVAHKVACLEQEHVGELRITTSDSLLLHLLAPIIAEFKALNPAIAVEVIVANDSLNLARGESDIALRATSTPPENLFGRKLATLAWAPYGRRLDIGSNELLADREWVSYGGVLSNLKASRFVDARVPKDKIAFRADSVMGVIAAVVSGLGVGYLPCMSGELVPELKRIGATEPCLADDLWLLTHPDIKNSWRVRAFMEHCATAITDRRQLIEGCQQINL